MNWKTFYTRTITAIVFVIIMLLGLLGPKILFFLLFATIQYLGIHEYFILAAKINNSPIHDSFKTKMLVQFVALIQLILAGSFFSHAQGYFIPSSLCLISTVLLIALLSPKNAFQNMQQAAVAFIYIAMPISMLIMMREKSPLIPLALIALIWINDTMAYIVGSFIGKRPLSSISPKKTWEGTIGGIVLTIAAAWIWAQYSPYYDTPSWLILALCAAIAGTFGDLLESKLKRLAQVKDSGTFMPGHGGALDRFDSLLLATPFAFGYSTLFMKALPLNFFAF